MADTNFKVFNEELSPDRTFSDAEYSVATQRQGGVIPGMALSRLHNKLYRQSTAMAKAIADFLVEQGIDCMDNDVPGITAGIQSAILSLTGDEYLQLAGGTMTGPIVLDADPTADMQAATKRYADENGGINLRRNSHTYAVGDICYSKTAASYKYMQCTVAGTTAATEPVWPDVGQTVVDGTVTWVVRDIRSGESIGSIKACLSNTPPPGWLALDTGAMVSRATYPQLWAWVQANAPLITEAEWQAQAAVQSSVGYYSTGDGSTTFRLPRILDYGRGGLSSEVGTWQGDATKEVLPISTPNNGYAAAVLNGQNNAILGWSDSVSSGGKTTYGLGGTETRPKSIFMLYCVKAFDAVINQGLTDITELANSVANKQATIGYIRVWDQKASGTSGGTFTSGAWRTRDLNQLKTYGNINGVSLTGNQLTIPAGTYVARASAAGCNVDGHKIRLRNITAGTNLAIGSTEQSAAPSASDWVQSNSVLGDVFTVGVTTVIELQHFSGSTFASFGFGAAITSGASNEVEIYASLELIKIA